MFGALKRLFKKAEAEPPLPATAPMATPSRVSHSPSPAPPAAPAPVPRPTRPPANAEVISVPYLAILPQVPTDLHGKLAPAGAGDSCFSVPRSHVLQQLAAGSVKVSFGELRREAPTGLFVRGSDQDNRMIALPLQEILSQVPGNAFARRTNQRVVKAAPDVPDLFGPKGERNAQLRVLPKSEAKPAAAPRPLTPPARPSKGTEFRRSPAAPIAPATPRQPAAQPAAAPAAAPEAKPPTAQKISAPALAAALTAHTSPAQRPGGSPRSSSAARAPVPVSENALRLPLVELARSWPEPVRQEIERLGCGASECALPMAAIADGLKSGKVEIPFKQIVGWLHPKPDQSCTTAVVGTLVELPLQLLVPLYLAQKKPGGSNKKVTVSDSVPDLFTKDGPVGLATPPANAKPQASSAATRPTEAPKTRESTNLAISLAVLVEQWPDPIRQEIDRFNLKAKRLELPLDVVEGGLRSGKVEFPWKQLCAWIKDCPQSVPTPPNAEVMLALPLNVVAPMFLKLRPSRRSSRAAEGAENIPDLFTSNGELGEDAAAALASQPAVSAASEADEPALAPAPAATEAPAKKPPQDIAELFGEPDKRNWTPNEIVHKVSCLPGVAGAMIALQDGLMVAHCMPPNWKTETIAAFLPQIFGRVTQYARELKMGDLRSFSFAVESGTLQIFAAGIIYFGVLGKPGQPLPQFELNLIATELSRHTK